MNITNVYWRSPINPAQDTATIETMINKENQLLVGDFNAHSQTWGNNRRDKAGQILEEKSIEMGFNINNTGEPTRITETKKQSHTAIDLTITTNNFPYEAVKWETLDDAGGSDHLPCLTTLIGEEEEEEESPPTLSFNTGKANWPEYQGILQNPKETRSENIHEHCQNILDEIKNAALKTIANNSKRRNKTNRNEQSKSTSGTRRVKRQ